MQELAVHRLQYGLRQEEVIELMVDRVVTTTIRVSSSIQRLVKICKLFWITTLIKSVKSVNPNHIWKYPRVKIMLKSKAKERNKRQ